MQFVSKCVYNFPIFGGFCAPTENPEPTFARHFSNEYTVPASGVFMRCLPLIESNLCCRRCGRFGTDFGRRNRRPVMVGAFWFSLIGWLFTMYAASAALLSAGILKQAAWAYGSVWHNETGTRLSVAVGLRGRVDTIDCALARDAEICAFALNHTSFHEVSAGVFERVVAWDDSESCLSGSELRGTTFASTWKFLASEAHSKAPCAGCRNTAMESVSFAISSVLSQIPQMATDLQRATRFGDVNCQATMGAVTSLIGFITTVSALGTFYRGCRLNLPEVVHWAGSNAVDWHMGPAFICFFIAAVMKLLDVSAHLLVPTPEARHTIPPPGLTLEEYMMLGVDAKSKDTSVGKSESSGTPAGSPIRQFPEDSCSPIALTVAAEDVLDSKGSSPPHASDASFGMVVHVGSLASQAVSTNAVPATEDVVGSKGSPLADSTNTSCGMVVHVGSQEPTEVYFETRHS